MDKPKRVPYHLMPRVSPPHTLLNGIVKERDDGAKIGVFDIEGKDSLYVKIERPVDDVVSVLHFGISKDAAVALCDLIMRKIH